MAYTPLFAKPKDGASTTRPSVAPKTAPKKGGYVPLFAGKEEPKKEESVVSKPNPLASKPSVGPRISELSKPPAATISPKYGPMNPDRSAAAAVPPTVPKKSVGDFLKRTAGSLISGVANAAKFATDYATKRPIETIKAVTGGNPILNALGPKVTEKANEALSPVIRTVNKPIISTVDKAAGYSRQFSESANVTSPEWEKASLKEKVTKRLPETAYYLAPQVAGSLAPYLVNPALGFGVSAGSTAEDVKQKALKDGMDEKKATDLGLATGMAVGLLDRIIPSKALPSGAKQPFIGGLVSRLLKSAGGEAGTEVAQEAIQIAAEATFREDLGWDEVKTRAAMAAVGGLLGGAGVSSVGSLISSVAGTTPSESKGYQPIFAGKEDVTTPEVPVAGNAQSQTVPMDQPVAESVKTPAAPVQTPVAAPAALQASPDASTAPEMAQQEVATTSAPEVAAAPGAAPAAPEAPVRAQAASRVFQRLQAENADLEGDLNYSVQNLKKNAEKAVDLIAQDRTKAYRIAMGVEAAPEDQTSTAVNIALAQKALDDGNTKLYSQLIRQRSLDQTRRGQELVAEKSSVTDNSVNRYVKELIQTRLDRLGKGYLGKLTNRSLLKSTKSRATAAIDAEVAKVQKRMKGTKELDLNEAQKFLDSLACT